MKNMLMNSKAFYKNLLILVLIFVIGCKDNQAVTPDPIDPPDSSENVTPVKMTLPATVFTDAQAIADGNTSEAIFDHLISMVDATPENASIYVSIYEFEYIPLVNALIRAHKRGVKLHVMMDGSSRSNNDETADKLSALTSDVEVVSIKNDASASAINHNKFMLFSKLKTTGEEIQNVVFETSMNFTIFGSSKIQDALTLSDKGMFDALLDYWDDMKALAAKGMKDFEYRVYDDPQKDATVFFNPKRKDGKPYGADTIIEILDDITRPASTTVKITMSSWTDSRMAIIDKLKMLQSQGAKVEVVTKSSIGLQTSSALEQMSANGAFVKIYNMSYTNQPKINIHSKFMIIEGEWRGAPAKVLVNGTQNFTINALRNNNETSFLFVNPAFMPSYKNYFERLKSLPGVCCSE